MTTAGVTVVVPAFRRAKVPAVTPETLSLMVAVMLAARLTPVAFTAGVRPITVGRGPVVKANEVAASGLPATSLIPAVRPAVNLASAARFAAGFRVAARVVAFQLTAAARVAPAAFFSENDDVFSPAMASLKVAVTLVDWLAPWKPAAGTLVVVTGAAVSTVTVRPATDALIKKENDSLEIASARS